jgi:uncharacterized protein YjiS (DUF1127 family)
MHGTLEISGQSSEKTSNRFDTTNLCQWALGDLWRVWWRVGRAIVLTSVQKARVHVRIWRDRERSRHLLTLLSQHELADMGLTPQQARWESSKPFWRD